MQLFRVTRGLRTPYDHYMLQMHDRMKADMDYQKNTPQLNFDFPPNTTWMVFTDQVPHAANAGHLVLEDAGDRILPLVKEFLHRHPAP